MITSKLILKSFKNTCDLGRSLNLKYMSTNYFKGSFNFKKSTSLATLTCLTVGTASGFLIKSRYSQIVQAASQGRPSFVPSRIINNNRDQHGLEVTLFQYQTCPFCCKVRAFLDYNGFNYNVIEVNSVFRKEIKWSDYKKVPILVVEGTDKKYDLQFNDSSLIISVLESYLIDNSKDLNLLNSYFPALEEKQKNGKIKYEYPNRYFLMYGDSKLDRPKSLIASERKMRKWVDETLVHSLSPNIYRTPSEALQAFKYFSQVGEWEKNFSYTERMIVIYVGAVAMYFVGKILKRRHQLQDNVRLSLYEACDEWVRTVGKENTFFGGDQPNLADISVYGVLTAIEGCDAFQDVLKNTKIKTWYYATKKCVIEHSSPDRFS